MLEPENGLYMQATVLLNRFPCKEQFKECTNGQTKSLESPCLGEGTGKSRESQEMGNLLEGDKKGNYEYNVQAYLRYLILQLHYEHGTVMLIISVQSPTVLKQPRRISLF